MVWYLKTMEVFMMKKFIKYIVFICLVSFIYLTFADNHMPKTYAMEGYQCDFADGKGLNDVLRVASKWDKWSDTNYSVPYAAWVMVPFYQTKTDFGFDLAWLGVSDSWQELGQAQDEWMEKGQRLQAEFDSVSPCDSHVAYWVWTIREAEETNPKGYLSVRGCNNNETTTLEQINAASAIRNEYFDSLGMDSAIYAWFPGAGSPLENTYDYLEVWANSSMKEWGIVPDAWLSGNPDPSGLSDLRECDTPRVYYSQYVGGKTAE